MIKSLIRQAEIAVFSATLKNTSVVFLGNAISSILGIIFTIIAARWLGPEKWGIVAALGNVIPIIVALVDLGIGSSVFAYTAGKWSTQDEKEAKKIYISAFTFRILSVVGVSLLLILFASEFTKLVFNIDYVYLGVVTALGFLSTSLLDFQIFAIEARQKWMTAAIYTALTNIFRVGLLILLYHFGLLSLLNVLLVFTASVFIVFILSIFTLPFGINVRGSVEFIKKFANFSLWMSGNKIVSTLSSRIDVILLLTIIGPFEAGIYGAANRLAQGVPLILGSFATVLAARFASLQGENLRHFFYKSIGLSFLIVFGLIVGIVITPFVTTLFGPDYQMSTSILQWLLLAMIPYALSTPAVNVIIYSFKKPNIITYLSIMQLIIVATINYLFLQTLRVYAPILAIGTSYTLTMFITYYFAFKQLSKR